MQWAEWMVSLHNDDAHQLQNYDHFMAALYQWFEASLVEHKTQSQMKIITQFRQSVAAYTQEFQELVYWLAAWPEDIRINCFKYGLHFMGPLQHWYVLADEIEIDLARD